MKKLDQERLIVRQIGQSSARKVSTSRLRLLQRWHLAHLTHALHALLQERIHVRLKSFDIALNHSQIVRVLFARLVDAIVSSVGRLVRARLATEAWFWFRLALLGQRR